MEIERKFRVDDPPEDLAEASSQHIRQGYLALDGDGVEVRVRQRGTRSTMTIKQGTGLVRLEEEVAIGRERFERLWPLTEGRRIEKVRHVLDAGGATLELDVYGGGLAGLVVAEVEFDSVQASQAFVAPPWLGEEVTGDTRYLNRTLAVDGWPGGRPRYRLCDDHGAPNSLHRVARAQLDKAAGGLHAADGDALGDAVHQTRKSLKRLRSAIRLTRDELGDSVYRRENDAYRDIGRRLSGARDSQVMLETLDGLLDRDDGPLDPTRFARLRDALRKDHERAQARLRADTGTIAEVLDELRAARSRTALWPVDGIDIAGLGPGFRRAYRRGRKALRHAEADAGDEALHDLRKRVKDLWYMSELVRPAAPKRAKKLARRASDLSDVIGEDHDLAVLRETIERDHRRRVTAADLRALTDVIDRRRAALQDDARAEARQLYRRRPGKLVRRLGLRA